MNFGAKTDLFKVAVATDHVLKINLADENKLTYNVDVALNAVFGEKFATLDAYYSNKAKAKTAYSKKTTNIDNLLSAKVAFDLEEFGAPLKLSVAALNMLKALELDAEATITIADLHTITAYAKDILAKKTGLPRTFGVKTELVFEPVTINVDVHAVVSDTDLRSNHDVAKDYVGYTIGAEYENEYFTANFSVTNDFSYAEEPATPVELTFAAGIVAEGTVIENATIGLAYESGNVLNEKFGAVTAYCGISF